MGSYVPNTKQEREKMLEEAGFKSIDEMFADIPEDARFKTKLNIPAGLSELDVIRRMQGIAGKNKVFSSIFRGAGAYHHYIPAIVKSVLSNETVQTAYTPYQAEISQGLLQSFFEYQTMICELTGMDVSNASVYDGAEAAAEAVAMCRDKKRGKAYISAASSPYTIETVKTYCFGSGMELELIPEKDGVTDLEFLRENLDTSAACVYIEHPNYYGSLEDVEAISSLSHEAGAKFIMGVNPISLGILKTPGEYGADIAVGEGQPLGLSMSFGGPYLGFMACTSKLMRKLPGRIVGQTEDSKGRTGYVLTLQAREQHIRRETASSNICSNQALCAMAVGVYLAAMGPDGLKNAAVQCASKAHYFSEQLEKAGLKTQNTVEFFHEFVTASDVPAEVILKKLEEENILGGYPLDENRILWCCTEMNTKDEMDRAAAVVADAVKTAKEVR